eukprot:TRINITY_DN65040_c0_g1_i1.p1 TRINITY_DN65040_c0_g1~~TRINITY_DN65040_c0_g1_i1.p1  ORF type:complete len:269 (+),score=69.09 TRINITY_DN65040_c0_g1_i1:106-807(+)
MAPEEADRVSNIEDDLIEGGKFCLQFLADSIGGGDANCAVSALAPPYMDEFLGDRLQAEVKWLREANHDWRWELSGGFDGVKIDRIFVILGASRTGVSHTGVGLVNAFGQQFVLRPQQTDKFVGRDAGFESRMSVFQELLFGDMVAVADVSVTVKQRSGLSSTSAEGEEKSAVKLEEEASIEHVLRLEMPLHHDRSSGREVPNMRLGSWQLVDWNWVCRGNHPALPPDVPAPW